MLLLGFSTLNVLGAKWLGLILDFRYLWMGRESWTARPASPLANELTCWPTTYNWQVHYGQYREQHDWPWSWSLLLYQSSFEILVKKTAEKGLSVHTGNNDLCTIYADTDVHAPFLLNYFLWHERIDNVRNQKWLHGIIRYARMQSHINPPFRVAYPRSRPDA